MSELNSSLCQLNWLIAKSGIDTVHGMSTVSEEVEASENVKTCPKIDCFGNVAAASQVMSKLPPISSISEKADKRKLLYDGLDKPPYSYSQLIRLAIEDTVDKKCTLADIYSFISQNFRFYRENRNSSWKNSIRHNLSLNKQFSRVEKADGDRRGWWVCVEPPAKKPRILKGSPVRVNPIYEQLYQHKQDVLICNSLPDNHLILETNGNSHDLTDQEIRELNLFESYDLNSSFRDVYNQIFEKPTIPNEQRQAAQIDWLKISLEAAGLDYQDEHELLTVDTDKLKDYVHNGFPSEYDSDASTPRTDSSSRHSSSDSGMTTTLHRPMHNDSDDEYDWDRLL